MSQGREYFARLDSLDGSSRYSHFSEAESQYKCLYCSNSVSGAEANDYKK